jgi:hypothetical protein
LLDLYLEGQYTRESIWHRQRRIESKIEQMEQERDELAEQLVSIKAYWDQLRTIDKDKECEVIAYPYPTHRVTFFEQEVG